jgi:alpha 1,2-mannosyltransferase
LQYVLLNDVPFTDHFKQTVREVVFPASVSFGGIPEEEWSIPPCACFSFLPTAARHVPVCKATSTHGTGCRWINAFEVNRSMARMKAKGVIYGDSLSYRHMCRYFSGFFFRHPLVMSYGYYWRIGVPQKRL